MQCRKEERVHGMFSKFGFFCVKNDHMLGSGLLKSRVSVSLIGNFEKNLSSLDVVVFSGVVIKESSRMDGGDETNSVDKVRECLELLKPYE